MNMKKKRFIKNAIALIMSIIVTMMIAIVISLIAAIPVYFLWNWLIPDIFGLTTINFIQTVGLCFLVKLLLPSSSTVEKNKKN